MDDGTPYIPEEKVISHKSKKGLISKELRRVVRGDIEVLMEYDNTVTEYRITMVSMKDGSLGTRRFSSRFSANKFFDKVQKEIGRGFR